MAAGGDILNEVPMNREAEEAVIASVLIDPAVLTDLHFLKPSDFYILRNGWIWDAIGRLHERRSAIDPLTVAAELDTMGKLLEVGGSSYITGPMRHGTNSL